MMANTQAMAFALIVITCQTELWRNVHAESRTMPKYPGSKSNSLRRKSMNDFTSRNNGPPLDMNNKLQKVQNNEKRPDSQPNKVKSRKGRLVTRSQHLLRVKDFNVTSSIDSAEEGTIMELSSVGKNLVTIKGVRDNRFICMNRENGEMFARASANKDCIFKEFLEENFHSTFRLNDDSSPWFIAIDSKGNFMLKVTRKLDFSTYFQLIS